MTHAIKPGQDVKYKSHQAMVWSIKGNVAAIVTNETLVNGEPRQAWTTWRSVELSELTPTEGNHDQNP